MIVRILGVDYIINEKLLTICVADNINGCINIVHTDNFPHKSEKESIEICKQFYNEFDCDRIASDDLKINFR